MLKTYRVVSAFWARQLHREPTHEAFFSSGDLIEELRRMGDHIEFCRRDDEGVKLEYTILESDLLQVSEEVPGDG